jgi:hypothetical protein
LPPLGSLAFQLRCCDRPGLGQAVDIKEVIAVSGLSTLWITTQDSSISRLVCWNHSTTRSARGCYLCSRYILSPMSPGRTQEYWSAAQDSSLRPPGLAIAESRHTPNDESEAIFGLLKLLSAEGGLFQDFISCRLDWREVYNHIHFTNFALPDGFDCERRVGRGRSRRPERANSLPNPT